MRHHNANRKFNRTKNQRKALLKSLALALITKEKIETTEQKAKEVRPFIERLITTARKGTLAAHRNVQGVVGSIGARKLITELGPRYKDRNGGYTRIVKSGERRGDASSRAYIELV